MGVLRLAPWRRGPRLLADRPAVAVALGAAAFVAALPAAAAPLFLSSAEHATLHRQIDESCPSVVGVEVTGHVGRPGPARPDEVVGIERYERRAEVVAAALPAGLEPPVVAAYGEFDLSTPDGAPVAPGRSGVTILARDDGAASDLDVVDGPDGPGLWLPDGFAAEVGLGVGDEVRLTPRGEPTVWGDAEEAADAPDPQVTVAAIYRDLRPGPDRDDWCGVREAYRGPPGAEDSPDATVLPMGLLDDPSDLLTIGETTRARMTQVVATRLTDDRPEVPEAAAIGTLLDAARRDLASDHPALFTQFNDPTTWESVLTRHADRAALVRRGLLPPVLPITAAGTAAGLAMTAAAAVYWGRRRRRELAVLAAHGASAGQLGVKAVLEAAPPVVVGSVLGWAAAWGLIATVGPSPALAPGTLPRALAAAVAVGAAAATLTGVVAGWRARTLTDQPPVAAGVRWWARVPWEVALLVAAPVAWFRLTGDVTEDVLGGAGSVAHVPARLLVAPLLALVGGCLLIARVTAATLRRRGLRRTPSDPSRLLAWRRIVRDAVPTAVLAATTAVPLAMATFGATATASIRTTDDATLGLALGSDAVLILDRETGPVALPPEAAERATQLLRVPRQLVGGQRVDVLGVDPATFPGGAFWDARLPEPALDQVVTQLEARSVPTAVASSRLATGPATLLLRGEEVPVDVVDTRPLPGTRAGFPALLVHRDVLEEQLGDALIGREELWLAGDVRPALDALAAARVSVSRQDLLEDLRVGAIHEPVSYTFQYLTALSILTGLIGAAGLVLHLEARTAAHRRAYVVLRRLGLSAAAHRRSLLLEVGGPLVAGIAVGLGGASLAARVFGAGFDLDPRRVPDAVLVLPGALMVALAGTAAVVAVAAALVAQARLGRAAPSEVLRDPD